LEDFGYYAVDNLPSIWCRSCGVTKSSTTFRPAALVIDIREGEALQSFPEIYKRLRRIFPHGSCLWRQTTRR